MDGVNLDAQVGSGLFARNALLQAANGSLSSVKNSSTTLGDGLGFSVPGSCQT